VLISTGADDAESCLDVMKTWPKLSDGIALSDEQLGILVSWAFPDDDVEEGEDEIPAGELQDLKNILHEIFDDNTIGSPTELIDAFAKKFKKTATVEQTTRLQERLFPDLRFKAGGSERKSTKRKPVPGALCEAGALEKSQIQKLGRQFLSLMKASISPSSLRSKVSADDISETTINNNIINIINEVMGLMPTAEATMQNLLLPKDSINIIIQLFHDTINDCRRGLGIQSKQGIEACRKVFADFFDYLSKSSKEIEKKAYQYLKILNKPPGPLGGRWTYFNIIPSYHEISKLNKNDMNGVITTQGAYVSNVGAGVSVAKAIKHVASLIKSNIVIPQTMKLSLVIVVSVNHVDAPKTRILSVIDEKKREMYDAALMKDLETYAADKLMRIKPLTHYVHPHTSLF